MTLEVLDNMLYTYGDYLILELLYNNLSKDISLFSLVPYIIASILYNCIHSMV